MVAHVAIGLDWGKQHIFNRIFLPYQLLHAYCQILYFMQKWKVGKYLQFMEDQKSHARQHKAYSSAS